MTTEWPAIIGRTPPFADHPDRASADHPDPDLFYNTRNPTDVEAAKAVCGRCPLKAECLDFGMGERFGVWGGLTPTERAALGQPRPDSPATVRRREVARLTADGLSSGQIAERLHTTVDIVVQDRARLEPAAERAARRARREAADAALVARIDDMISKGRSTANIATLLRTSWRRVNAQRKARAASVLGVAA